VCGSAYIEPNWVGVWIMISGFLYYGVHAGGGCMWNIWEKANLDLSMQYI